MSDLEALKNGDENALSQFVREELPKVYNLCLRLCHSPQEAEDLSQDVFVRAIRAIPEFKGKSALSTWLYRITMNTWKNKVRYEKRRFTLMHTSISRSKRGDEESESPLELPDKSPTPEKIAEQQDTQNKILLALDGLGAEERAIVILKDIEDKSYEEIAAILDLNLGTVKSRLSRAREMLSEVVIQLGVRHP